MLLGVVSSQMTLNFYMLELQTYNIDFLLTIYFKKRRKYVVRI